jgi:hypothetical protein
VYLIVDRRGRALHPGDVTRRLAPTAPPAALPAALLPLALLVSSCGGGGAAPGGKTAQVRSAPPPTRVTPSRPGPSRPVQRPAAQVQTIPGLEGVIGADALQLGRVFGTPRLDVIEDDARKMQWTGTACILDVYLYPQAGGAKPTATYVDARRGDGRDVDRAACVAALRKAP